MPYQLEVWVEHTQCIALHYEPGPVYFSAVGPSPPLCYALSIQANIETCDTCSIMVLRNASFSSIQQASWQASCFPDLNCLRFGLSFRPVPHRNKHRLLLDVKVGFPIPVRDSIIPHVRWKTQLCRSMIELLCAIRISRKTKQKTRDMMSALIFSPGPKELAWLLTAVLPRTRLTGQL